MLKLTPGMQQYMKIKNENPDCLVLFRMGDFYETFFDDAKTAARALDIVLTKRGGRNPVPLAGIPYHALDQYLAKLIKQGFKVAIVEQTEDPKKAKGLVKRDLIRIVTPGTVIESNLLDEGENNYLMSVAVQEGVAGIALADISTGEFMTTELGLGQLQNEIAKFRPKELIFASSLEDEQFVEELKNSVEFVSPYAEHFYFRDNAYEKLKTHFKVGSLDVFGIEERNMAVSASGALLSYLHETQKNSLQYLNKLRFYSSSDYMLVDLTTQRNLELVQNVRSGAKDGTLIKVLDSTNTSMGSRMLKSWLLKPLLSIDKINKRLDAVEEFNREYLIREELKENLKAVNDIERLISRISYGSASPKDLIALKTSIDVVPYIKKRLDKLSSELLKEIFKINDVINVSQLIATAIRDEPAAVVSDGNVIRDGYNAELDELRGVSRDGKSFIRSMETKERARTGIKSLKVRFNKVFGYFIEITKANLHLVPSDYIRKQTQVNSERFITEELKEKEDIILNAQEKIVELEQRLFRELLDKISAETENIQKLSAFIAQLDVLLGFATVAVNNQYVRPVLNEGYDLKIEDGRHPVVEQVEDIFISNHTKLDEDTRMMIITGPNMAGKSVYMRQVGLIVLLAQIGCFVPAKSAELGIVDRIFTRVGAFDDLSHGQSTFMVEMTQTANILNNATERSLIILDEIGRGTSTYDGLAIAWGVAEYLISNVKAKTLFATHYHLLNTLTDQHLGVSNYNIAVQEDRGNIVFLHKLVEGGTDKSYGIHVAKLAGMPKEAIERAKEMQFKLENKDQMHQRIIVEKKRVKDPRSQAETIEYNKVVQKKLDEL